MKQGPGEQPKEEKKETKIQFNRNIGEYNAEQQEYVADLLHQYNHIFDYCCPQVDEADPLYELTKEQFEEQQTKCHFFKYPEEKYFGQLVGSFREMNKQALKDCLQLAKDNKLHEKVYIVNEDKANQLRLPTYPDFMKCSMREKEQVRKHYD